MVSFEDSLKQTFLDEGQQLLEEAEECFLQLEVAGHSQELVNKVFRLVHSLKGSAKAVGFLDLSDLTHHLENLLVRLKGGEVEPTAQVVSFLLEAVDTLKGMIGKLRHNPLAKFDTQELETKLATFLPQDSEAHTGTTLIQGLVAVDEGIVFNAQELKKFKESQQGGANHPKQPEVKSYQPEGSRAHPEEHKDHGHEETIRVNLKRIDSLINNVGELVILQSVLTQHRSSLESRLLQSTIVQLEKITHVIQDTTMGLRMVPVKGVFLKLQRIIRDTAQALGKTVDIQMKGEETELDRNMLEQINDPLVHVVRNAVDHGIETDAERSASGKNSHGCVTLSAYHHGNRIVIEVRDNGSGIDTERVLAKARRLGLVAPEAELSQKEIFELLFQSGFSTKDQATDISGRGVGLDVVNTNIKDLNGDIEIESTKGEGTCFRLALPLTLSIIEGMIVMAGNERYVLPTAVVSEIIQPTAEDIHSVNERGQFLNLRGESIPIFGLRKILKRGSSPQNPCEGILIVVRDGRRPPFSLLVDDILSKQQVVIKSLGEELAGIPGFSGGAILGDGRAALIVEVGQIVPMSS